MPCSRQGAGNPLRGVTALLLQRDDGDAVGALQATLGGLGAKVKQKPAKPGVLPRGTTHIVAGAGTAVPPSLHAAAAEAGAHVVSADWVVACHAAGGHVAAGAFALKPGTGPSEARAEAAHLREVPANVSTSKRRSAKGQAPSPNSSMLAAAVQALPDASSAAFHSSQRTPPKAGGPRKRKARAQRQRNAAASVATILEAPTPERSSLAGASAAARSSAETTSAQHALGAVSADAPLHVLVSSCGDDIRQAAEGLVASAAVAGLPVLPPTAPGAPISDMHSSRVTHIVVGNPRKRTLKVLRALACRAWVLKPSWVTASAYPGGFPFPDQVQQDSSRPSAERAGLPWAPESRHTWSRTAMPGAHPASDKGMFHGLHFIVGGLDPYAQPKPDLSLPALAEVLGWCGAASITAVEEVGTCAPPPPVAQAPYTVVLLGAQHASSSPAVQSLRKHLQQAWCSAQGGDEHHLPIVRVEWVIASLFAGAQLPQHRYFIPRLHPLALPAQPSAVPRLGGAKRARAPRELPSPGPSQGSNSQAQPKRMRGEGQVHEAALSVTSSSRHSMEPHAAEVSTDRHSASVASSAGGDLTPPVRDPILQELQAEVAKAVAESQEVAASQQLLEAAEPAPPAPRGTKRRAPATAEPPPAKAPRAVSPAPAAAELHTALPDVCAHESLSPISTEGPGDAGNTAEPPRLPAAAGQAGAVTGTLPPAPVPSSPLGAGSRAQHEAHSALEGGAEDWHVPEPVAPTSQGGGTLCLSDDIEDSAGDMMKTLAQPPRHPRPKHTAPPLVLAKTRQGQGAAGAGGSVGTFSCDTQARVPGTTQQTAQGSGGGSGSSGSHKASAGATSSSPTPQWASPIKVVPSQSQTQGIDEPPLTLSGSEAVHHPPPPLEGMQGAALESEAPALGVGASQGSQEW